MIVQHNMNAINAYNKLNANVAGLKKSSEKLASGYRINRAGDDAAGLAISEKMRSQIRGLNQAVRNSQDGINMIQTFEGAAQETHNILQRMKELAMESANGTYDNSVDRAAIQLEFEQLNDELNQIADTDFNG
ncbi:MAG: flagellar hook protein, partial [Oscillospiraceae bacterium]|nr:flagellar hook protein [Oscillospiraceae bacterium]